MTHCSPGKFLLLGSPVLFERLVDSLLEVLEDVAEVADVVAADEELAAFVGELLGLLGGRRSDGAHDRDAFLLALCEEQFEAVFDFRNAHVVGFEDAHGEREVGRADGDGADAGHCQDLINVVVEFGILGERDDEGLFVALTDIFREGEIRIDTVACAAAVGGGSADAFRRELGVADSFLDVGCASAIVYIAGLEKLPVYIGGWLLGLTDNKYLFLLIINLGFLLMGMVFDTNTITLIFLPMVLGTVQALHIDLIHFGVIFVVNMMIGLLTPPFGNLLFTTSAITSAPMNKLIKRLIPMIGVLFACLLLLTYIPQFSTFLPSMMLGK